MIHTQAATCFRPVSGFSNRVILGIIGVLLSLSAKKRGGIVSFASVAAGLIGIIAAIVKASLYIFG